MDYKIFYKPEERKQLIISQIIALRSAKGYTQKEVAEAIGVKVGTYNAYECMRSEPNSEIIVRLAYLYGITTDEILQKENRMNDPKYRAEKIDEYQETMKKLQEEAEKGNPEAIEIQKQMIEQGTNFFANLMKNIPINTETDTTE